MTLQDLLDAMMLSPKNPIYVTDGRRVIYKGPADGMMESDKFPDTKRRSVHNIHLHNHPDEDSNLLITLR